MPSVKQDHQCIERRAVRALTDDGSRFFYSVSEYEDARRKARTLSNPRALSFPAWFGRSSSPRSTSCEQSGTKSAPATSGSAIDPCTTRRCRSSLGIA